MADFLYLEVEETSLSVTVLAINQKTNNLILEVKKLNIHYRENPTIHVICYTPRGRYINCISLPVDCVRIPPPPPPPPPLLLFSLPSPPFFVQNRRAAPMPTY